MKKIICLWLLLFVVTSAAASDCIFRGEAQKIGSVVPVLIDKKNPDSDGAVINFVCSPTYDLESLEVTGSGWIIHSDPTATISSEMKRQAIWWGYPPTTLEKTIF
tara:strand:+ start:1334 stop:1648 length:315 start_codon:yes stop_codon:yes gene_type:complete